MQLGSHWFLAPQPECLINTKTPGLSRCGTARLQLPVCRRMRQTRGRAASRRTSVAACHGVRLVLCRQRPVHELLRVHDLHQLRRGMPHACLHSTTDIKHGMGWFNRCSPAPPVVGLIMLEHVHTRR